LDIFVVIPRSDNRELDSGLLCVFAERKIVEDNGDLMIVVAVAVAVVGVRR
jgi:hypothetical protein